MNTIITAVIIYDLQNDVSLINTARHTHTHTQTQRSYTEKHTLFKQKQNHTGGSKSFGTLFELKVVHLFWNTIFGYIFICLSIIISKSGKPAKNSSKPALLLFNYTFLISFTAMFFNYHKKQSLIYVLLYIYVYKFKSHSL